MGCSFEEAKNSFDNKNGKSKKIECFLPVHLNTGLTEDRLYKKDGTHNEQYYKWQFLYSLVEAGLCDRDYIGTEVYFPKGNKNSASIEIDAAIFDDADWFEHYKSLYESKDSSKWDELNWLKSHLLCCIEFKKEGSKDVKGVFNSQLKSYMNESSKNCVFGILYDFGRLYLFRSEGKKYLRLSDEFNLYDEKDKEKVEIDFSITDSYRNILPFNKMVGYSSNSLTKEDYSHRTLDDLETISANDSRKMKDSLYRILSVMDSVNMVDPLGYNILIQLLSLKIYDEKKNFEDLEFYINKDEEDYKDLSDDNIQGFIERISKLTRKAKKDYKKILEENVFDSTNKKHLKIAISIVKEFQNYSFRKSERNNLYQLVFHVFASAFSKQENAQFTTPLEIIDFIVDMVNPKRNESIIDPTVGIADFLSVSYVKSDGKLDDSNVYGMDIDPNMIKLSTLNMLLNGDGNAVLESVDDEMGSIYAKFDENGNVINLVPKTDKNNFNYDGNWDNRADNKVLKKFDIVLTNPPFGKARAFNPKTTKELETAQCYHLWNKYNKNEIDKGVLFLENAVRILDTHGRMGIVLSNSIASIPEHKEARKWLIDNMRIVAIIDLPSQIFAEAGVSPTIIIAYKPTEKELKALKDKNYEVFSKEIKKVGYEVKTKNKVKSFVPVFKIDPITFEKEINSDGSPKRDEEFTETIKEFRTWCNSQEKTLKDIFL